MLNIVILGAGDIGSHIASLLSRELHNVIVIDKNQDKLEALSTTMDIAVRHGSGTNWKLLDDLLDISPDYLVAVTESDEINLVACNIAKHLGYPKTIARIRDNLFLNRTRLDFAHIFEVDCFIGPELSVANDILKYILRPSAIVVEQFAHGAVQMRTLTIPSTWKRGNTTISQLALPAGVMIGLIGRKQDAKPNCPYGTVIFPHGNDTIQIGDEVTLIGETETLLSIHRFFEVEEKPVKSVVIVGGSLTAINLARLLKKTNVDVRIIEKDYTRCKALTELLPDSTVIHHDASDIELLKEEKIGQTDLFVVATHHDETNLMIGILGKEVGARDVIALLSNTSYAPFISLHGINHIFSPKINAAKQVLSFLHSGKVTSLVSFYDNHAEILEINVSVQSKLVGIPIYELGPYLPKDFLIAMIQNRGRIMVAHGNRIISPGDTVIVITNPKHLHEMESYF